MHSVETLHIAHWLFLVIGDAVRENRDYTFQSACFEMYRICKISFSSIQGET